MKKLIIIIAIIVLLFLYSYNHQKTSFSINEDTQKTKEYYFQKSCESVKGIYNLVDGTCTLNSGKKCLASEILDGYCK